MVMLFVGMTVNAQDYKKQSFIPEAAMPDAGIYLPAPPDTASYQFNYDFRQYWWGRKMREDKERAAQAKFDANFDVDSVLVGLLHLLVCLSHQRRHQRPTNSCA